MAQDRLEREKIYCEHSDLYQLADKARPEEWAIDIGNNRIVILCDLCAAKASMEVVREFLRELRPQIPPLSTWQR